MPKKSIELANKLTLLPIVTGNRITLSPQMLEHLKVEPGDHVLVRYDKEDVLEIKRFDKKTIRWENK